VDLPSKYICLAILLTVCFSLNTFCDFILVSEDLFILICSSDFLSYMSLLLDNMYTFVVHNFLIYYCILRCLFFVVLCFKNLCFYLCTCRSRFLFGKVSNAYDAHSLLAINESLFSLKRKNLLNEILELDLNI
jgi:hypothetical protein